MYPILFINQVLRTYGLKLEPERQVSQPLTKKRGTIRDTVTISDTARELFLKSQVNVVK